MNNSTFIDGVLEINTKYFYKFLDDADQDRKFGMIKGYVFQQATEGVYIKLTKQKEIEVLERLPKEKKEKYCRLANIFCEGESEEKKIIASRAAYILELITSTY